MENAKFWLPSLHLFIVLRWLVVDVTTLLTAADAVKYDNRLLLNFEVATSDYGPRIKGVLLEVWGPCIKTGFYNVQKRSCRNMKSGETCLNIRLDYYWLTQ